MEDQTVVIQRLNKQIEDLEVELARVKEDKAENEAAYERTIKYYQQALRVVLATMLNNDEGENNDEQTTSDN